MIKFVDELKPEDLNGKKILLRADFDVPFEKGIITEEFRVKGQIETLNYLVNAGAKVLIVAHIGHDVSDTSFYPMVEQLGEILGHTITLLPHSELVQVETLFQASPVLLLDNLRQDKREIENDDSLATALSNGFDYYVDNAFAVMHRAHASVVAITKHLPSYAGLLVKKEIENLYQAINTPAEGKVLVLGGAKISTKLPVIKNFIDRAEKILVGGAIANNFFKGQGVQVGSSVVDDTPIDVNSDKIILPTDMLVSDGRDGGTYVETRPVKSVEPEEFIVDIGPETVKVFVEIIAKSSMVIWNGPVGLSEIEKFKIGTDEISKAVAGSSKSIIGGGDTIKAVDKIELLDKMSFVSTGGGAMLDFLAGEKMPGLEALNYYV